MRLLLILLLTLNLLSAKKIALLIGNSDYPFAPLKNPLHDVDAIYKTLKEIKFDDIKVLKNASKVEIERALANFSQRAQSAEIALIYFSGHGMQVNNTNYMLPARTNPKKPVDLFGLVNLDYFIQSATSAKYGIVLVDACRDNPLVKYFQNGRHKGLSAKKGLGQVTPTTGQMVIGFATTAGETADDGNGNMSPYAEALSRRLKDSDDIRNILGKVAKEVSKKYDQNPIYRANLAESVYLSEKLKGDNNSDIDTSTPEKLAKFVLRTFRENNKELFINTVVANKNILQYLLNSFNLTKNDKNNLEKTKKQLYELKYKLSYSWNNINTKSELNNINWNKISNITINYKKVTSENGIEHADIYIMFYSNKNKFIIKLDDASKINNRWYLFDGMRWKK